jgi:peptidoglycan/LPS O-acetylase OafA/YrhL
VTESISERFSKQRFGPQQPSYLAHVDGLRAVAIMLVVFYHAWPTVVTGGFIGVDVFFVISGFLITRLIVSELEAEKFSMPAFLARRVRRLLPAAVVCFLIILILGALVLLPPAYREFGRSLISAALIHANYLFYRKSGYFETAAEETPLLHTWSLSVEDQFYLTWPVLLLLLFPFASRRVIVAIAVLLALLSLLFAEYMVQRDASYAFFILWPRAWELLAGCLLALRLADLKAYQKTTSHWVLSLTGLSLILGSAFALSPESTFPGVSALPAVAGTSLIIVAGLQSAPPNPVLRGLSWPPMVFVGLISYSLYLWHWPLITLGRMTAGRPLDLLEMSAVIATSAILAILSWQFVELPFRIPKDRETHSSWLILGVGIAVMLVVAGLGAAVKSLDGLPQRFDGKVCAIFQQISKGNPYRGLCDGTQKLSISDKRCNFGAAKKESTSFDIAILGDSNADHFVPMLMDWTRARGLSGRQVTQSACAALFGFRNRRWSERKAEECAAYHIAIKNFVEKNPNLKLVVLAGAWKSYQGPVAPQEVESGNLLPLNRDRDSSAPGYDFERALRLTVQHFVSRGIRVHIVGAVPHFKVFPGTCVARAIAGGEDTDRCGRRSTEVLSTLVPIDKRIASVAADFPEVSASFPKDAICDANFCVPFKDGVFLYRDPGHLSRAGSQWLGRHLKLPQIEAPSTP